MSKEHISATVDPQVAQYLDREGINASATVNRLVKQQMEAGTTQEELIKLRISQVRGEKETLENRLESAEKQLETLEERLENVQQANQQQCAVTVQEAAERLKPSSWLSSLPKEEQIPPADSEEIQQLATQADMDATEFRDRVITYILGDAE